MKRRLFVGIDVPSATKKALGKIQSQLERNFPTIRWEREESYHVTLAFLGSTAVSPQKILIALSTKLTDVSSFALMFTEVGVIQHTSTIIAVEVGKSEPLLQLYHKVTNELETLGFPKPGRHFHPHLTIGRSKTLTNIPTSKIDQQVLVTSVTLFESQLTQDGSTYTSLGAINLLRTSLV